MSKEKGDDIVFLRKIIKGGADKSYGIQVARLAGVPDMVIDRAKEIVEQLSDNDITEKVQSISIVDGGAPARKQEHYDELDLEQISLFDTVTDADVLDELKNVEVSTMTPEYPVPPAEQAEKQMVGSSVPACCRAIAGQGRTVVKKGDTDGGNQTAGQQHHR
mgnify:CR=1 FL=1